ncbi:nucleotide-binding universal stress UspA family protein [Microbacterium sp. AK009]|uniref:universal stress protein n=1 Tax=Microbacterium sp. AK009 TaxID=2723068 RepID=UPI0015CAF33F|nr:universal stress protein [Microbacterium sp. AK009]NYF17263.1 nucleotide-binding universal stress UspA family protein [Microbacterium sp. AK009]
MTTDREHDLVIAAVDGSPSSIEALRYASRLADALHAPLDAVITWSYPPYSDPAFISAWSPQDDATTILDDAVRQVFGENPPAHIGKRVLAGAAAPTLIDLSRSAAMLVLGSRGLGGFAGLLLGSVSAACAEHAHCPVLVVHPRVSPVSADEPSVPHSARR